MLSPNRTGSTPWAMSWTVATPAVDMPQEKSFLLTPLEPVDSVHEQPEDYHRDLRSPEISPTPQKSLFEMDSEDLRAAERAWLQTLGSFKLNSTHTLGARKATDDDSPCQKALNGCSTAEDQTLIPSDFHEPSLRPVSNEQLPDSADGTKLNDQEISKACRELTDRLSLASEEDPLLTVAEEDSASLSRHSMSLRQRFSVLLASRRSGNSTYASIPSSELSPAQGLGTAISDVGLDAAAPRAAMGVPVTEQPASASLPAVRHEATGSTSAESVTAAARAVSPSQPDLTSVSADALKEPDNSSQPHALAAAADALGKLDRTPDSSHMQRTPFTRLMSLRRPSTAWKRPSQLLEAPAEMLQMSTDLCTAQPAAPPSEGHLSIETAPAEMQGGPAEFDSSASAGQVGGPRQPTIPEPSHDTTTPTFSNAQLEQAAEPESRDSAVGVADLQAAAQEECETSADNQAESARGTLSGQLTAESGQCDVPAEPLNAAAESFRSLASSTSGRSQASHAALRKDPSNAGSLESACPCFADRLAHPAWRAQRPAASTGRTSMQQVEKKPMLRGRTAEECGVQMYERARAAQHARQTR